MWHYEKDGQSQGPVAEAELDALVAAGAVHAGTLAWREGYAAWLPLSKTDYAGRTLLMPAPVARPASASTAAAPAPAAVADPTVAVVDVLSLWRFVLRAYTRRFFKFTGRARRREFWSVAVFTVLLWSAAITAHIYLSDGSLISSYVNGMAGSLGLSAAALVLSPELAAMLVVSVLPVLLITLIPLLAVTVRRLHDVGLTGWLVLVGVLVPYLGQIGLIFMMFLPTEAVRNKHGPPPKQQ